MFQIMAIYGKHSRENAVLYQTEPLNTVRNEFGTTDGIFVTYLQLIVIIWYSLQSRSSAYSTTIHTHSHSLAHTLSW